MLSHIGEDKVCFELLKTFRVTSESVSVRTQQDVFSAAQKDLSG